MMVAHPQADCLQVFLPSRILLCSRAAAGVPPRGAEQKVASHERRSAVHKAWGFSVAVAGRRPIACACIVWLLCGHVDAGGRASWLAVYVQTGRLLGAKQGCVEARVAYRTTCC